MSNISYVEQFIFFPLVIIHVLSDPTPNDVPKFFCTSSSISIYASLNSANIDRKGFYEIYDKKSLG